MFTTSKESGSNELKMPGGAPAGNMNRIQLLLVWAKEYERRGKKIKYLGVGHPSAAVNPTVCLTSLEYWRTLKEGAKKISTDLNRLNALSAENIFQMCEEGKFSLELSSLISGLGWTNSYNDNILQERAAAGFNKFYLAPSSTDRKIKADHILPTQGGGGGLHNLFKYLSKEKPERYLALQLPYYTLYNAGPQGKNNKLFFFDVIDHAQYPIESQVSKISLRACSKSF